MDSRQGTPTLLNVSSYLPSLIMLQDIRLALNCVGGEPTTAMAKLLGQDAHLVSYGAMSKKPLSLPTSLHIFKNLTSHGFWQTNWSKTHSRAEKEDLIARLAEMMKEAKVGLPYARQITCTNLWLQIKAPEHTIITIGGQQTDEEATAKIRDVFAKVAQGKFGKKVLLKLEDVSL